MRNSNFNEGIEFGDLARLVQPKLSIDEFRSKMGEDKDIVVLGFSVLGKEPAEDIVNFVEKSYDWVLDADISSGETSDGNYYVFIELERDDKVPEKIMTALEDLMNLTDQEVSDWTFVYFKDPTEFPVDLESLQEKIVCSPEEYDIKNGDTLEEARKLDSLRAISGISIKPKVITDSELLSIQRYAGIK